MALAHVRSIIGNKNITIGAAFIFSVSLVCHLLYSWMGFNPTDEGFTLSGSRRLIDGEIIHKDFITAHPVGSYLLHTPDILFGDMYAFWFSRFLTLVEFASIAWFATLLFEKLTRGNYASWQKLCFSSIGFVLCVHTYPLMALHSVDALFLATIGTYLVTSTDQNKKSAGYFLLGYTALCRQNFLLVFPVVLFLFQDYKKIRHIIAGLLPIAVYACYLAVNGALPAALLQFSSQTNVYAVGVGRYIFAGWPVSGGTLIGFLALYLLNGRAQAGFLSNFPHRQQAIGILIMFSLLFASTFLLARPDWYVRDGSFALFGVTFGCLIFYVLDEKKQREQARAAAIPLITAWSLSVSLGYNSPALAGGVLAIFLLSRIYSSFSNYKRSIRRVTVGLTVLLVALSIAVFHYARRTYVYRDVNASQLQYSIDTLLPGTKMIKTSRNLYAYLQDLQNAIRETHGRPYAILPDFAAYWAEALRQNPFPIDWPNDVELNNPKLIARVDESIAKNNEEVVYILEKVRVDSIAAGFEPMPDSYSPVLPFIKQHLAKVAETKYFTLYSAQHLYAKNFSGK